jgi:hypothetical protein
MAKPSQKMIDMIVGQNLYLSNEIDEMANSFDKAYTFNQEPPQHIIDIMFEVFVSGILTGRSEQFKGCGPKRCADCKGQCGK